MNDNKPVSRDEFEKLLEITKTLASQNKKLIEQQNGPSLKARAVKEHTVTIFFINNKPVIGYENRGTPNKPSFIYEAPDPKDSTQRILKVNVLVKGMDQPIPLNYNEFLQEGERQDCLVLEVKKHAWEVEQGSVQKKSVEDDDYFQTEFGIDVPVVVEGYDRSFVVKLPDGEKLEIDQMFVNIAK